MKLNIFYILSKVFLIIILTTGLFFAFLDLSISRDMTFWSTVQMVFSIFALPVVVKLKGSNRLSQLVSLLIILPIQTCSVLPKATYGGPPACEASVLPAGPRTRATKWLGLLVNETGF